MLNWPGNLVAAHRKLQLVLLSLAIILGAAVFLPGISGPFIFDDFPNIVANNALRIQRINLDEIYQAAYSIPAVSSLQRPLAYISFALNGYFAGGFDNSTPFKLTNLLIHVFNGLLIFWMLHFVLKRHARALIHQQIDTSKDYNAVKFLAATIALLWLIQPIQITSVLYVVQRMTSLSATFVLLGILSYLAGRERCLQKRRYGYLLTLGGPIVFGTIGLLVKESAILLPVFILILELTLYTNAAPWRNWTQLSRYSRNIILTAVFIAAILALTVAAYWFSLQILPGYEGRLFSLQERLLTQPRVLFFYISLIFLPRINQFGVHHDDLVLSTSLLSPWTTLPAILGIMVAIGLAISLRKKLPLISLGIFWFFTGHLLESTFIPLEMVHEHRNYLASLGIILILVQLIYSGSRRARNQKILMLLPVIVLMFGTITYIRASQWSSYEKLVTYEAIHHPRSARAQLELGGMLAQRGYYTEAREAYLMAIENQPNDASSLVGLQLLRSNQNLPPDPDVDQKIIFIIQKYPLSATFFRTIGHVAECLQTSCTTLRDSMEKWTRTVLEMGTGNATKSRFSYLLATNLVAQNRIQEAIDAYKQSFELNRRNINALLSLSDLYIQLGRPEQAKGILNYIEKNNKILGNSGQKEIADLYKKISELRAPTN